MTVSEALEADPRPHNNAHWTDKLSWALKDCTMAELKDAPGWVQSIIVERIEQLKRRVRTAEDNLARANACLEEVRILFPKPREVKRG